MGTFEEGRSGAFSCCCVVTTTHRDGDLFVGLGRGLENERCDFCSIPCFFVHGKIDQLKRKLNKFLGQSGCENQKSNEVFMRFYETMRHPLHVARPCVWFQVSRCLHRICQAGNVRFMPEARCRRYSLHSLSSQG